MDPQRWAEIRTVFDELIELGPGERAHRLDEIAAADSALRDAVASLLVAEAAADDRLAELELPGLTQAGAGRSSRGAPDPFGLTGRMLSHFRVLEAIDAGGMGVVYRAEDTSLNRPVALKFLLPQFHLDDSAKQRFLHEARSAARLDHPNLCTIHEVGESEQGQLFLAMPLYPGETLRTRLAREGALPIEDALDIARQIAQGLACAHEAGIIHRDLKPGNVMLLPGGGVKILDFGLAKARDLSLTGSGATLGTVAYMAPEQIRDGRVDGRTDLWALGVVLYEMLTGRRPFAGEHEVAIVHAILHDEPLPPSELRPQISAEVERLVLTLMQRGIEGRYADAGEVIRTLRDSQGPWHGARASGRTWSGTRSRTGRRRAGRAVAGGVGVILTVAFLLLSNGAGFDRPDSPATIGTPAQEDTAERSIAVLPFLNLSSDPDQEHFSDGITEELLNALGQIDGLRVAARTSSFSFKGQSVAIDSIGRSLNVSYVLEGTVRRASERIRVTAQLIDTRDGYQLWSQAYDEELKDVFAIQDGIARAIAQALRVRLAGGPGAHLVQAATSSQHAYERYLQGLYQSNLGNRELALRHLEQAIVHDADFARPYVERARIYSEIPNNDPANHDQHTYMRMGREALSTALQLDPNLADARALLGGRFLYWYEWDFAAGEREVLHAVRLNPSSASAYYELAAIQQHRGRTEEALTSIRRARELDPIRAHYVCMNAYLLLHARRYMEALGELHVAERDHDTICGEAEGESYYMLGRLEEARSSSRKAWRGRSPEEALLLTRMSDSVLGALIAGETPRSDHVRAVENSRIPGGRIGLAKWYTWAGDHDSALRVMEEMVAVRNIQAIWITFPYFDPLRSEPRYHALLAKMGILETN